MHPRQRLYSILLVVVTLLTCFMIGEAVVRWADLEPPPLWAFSHPVGWTYKPNLRTWYVSSEFRSRVEINSRGLHDVERSYRKPPGAFRILALGDSFTAAIEVPPETSFPRLLQTTLGRLTAPASIEVINAGVGGFSTVQQLLFFRHEGIKYSPDLVLLTISDGDIRDNNPDTIYEVVPGAPYFRLKGEELELAYHPTSATTHLRRLLGHLRTARLVYRLAASLATTRSSGNSNAQRVPSMSSLYRVPRSPKWEEALATTKALIAQLNREVLAAGGRLVVLCLLPLEAARLSESATWQTPEAGSVEWEIAASLAATDIPALWVAHLLHEEVLRTGHPLRFPRDGHLNVEGHRLVARLAEEFLLEKHLVPVDGLSRGPRPTRSPRP